MLKFKSLKETYNTFVFVLGLFLFLAFHIFKTSESKAYYFKFIYCIVNKSDNRLDSDSVSD